MDGNPDDNFSLSSVFSQSYFVIPDYQRDYAWTESNVNDLLEDIDFVFEQNERYEDEDNLDHYFGTIVLEERGSIEPTDFEDYTQFAIVDGQQRISTVSIVISAIIDEMERIAQKKEVSEKMREDIGEKSQGIRENYIEYEGIPRLNLGGLANDVYRDVILNGEDIEYHMETSQLVETERKVLNAKKVTTAKLQEWKVEKCDDNGQSYASYYKFLKNIIRIITHRFEVNIKVVEDVDEAARMFKVINNRGRGLRLHDKVRSHLVYCASQSPDIDSKEVYRKFNNIVRNITIHDGFSDNEVDGLVKIHWAVFTSERSDSRAKRKGPSKIHRRLSDLENYASVQRDDFEEFITPYLNSLESFSEKYPYLTDRDMFAEKYSKPRSGNSVDRSEETVRKIQLLFMHSSTRTATAPLLISVGEKFGVNSSEFSEMVSELEKLVFGYSLVMCHGAQGYSNMVLSIANDLYWSDINKEDTEKIFNTENQRFVGYKSKELGIKKALDRIREKRERIGPIDDTVSEYLSEEDILNGEFTSGWGGIRNSEVVKYIMYEYERSIRDNSGLLSLSPYHEFRTNFQVEHLVAKNAEAGHRLENHERNRNRLGNLAILSSKDNNSENNKSYYNKYERLYNKSSLKVLRNLNGPEFTVDNISQREEQELFPFIEQRWG